MGLLSDITAYIDSLKRTAGNTLRETASDPIGLLQMRLSQIAEQLPAYPGKESVMPGVEGGGLLSRPNVVDWGQAVAMNANQPMGLLGPIVYHGSPNKFNKLDPQKIGSTTDEGELGHAFYFSTDPRVTDGRPYQYVSDIEFSNPLRIELNRLVGPESDKKKIVRRALGLPMSASAKEVTATARARGHDGVILDYSPTGYLHQEYAAFDPPPVKRNDVPVK